MRYLSASLAASDSSAATAFGWPGVRSSTSA